MIKTESMLKNVGYNIRELRKSKKMTIEELAEESYLSSKYLQGVEVGKRNISIKNLNRICNALETSPDILMNIKLYNLNTTEEKIFAIYEKLKKIEENKLDFIGNILDQIYAIIIQNSNNSNKNKTNKNIIH